MKKLKDDIEKHKQNPRNESGRKKLKRTQTVFPNKIDELKQVNKGLELKQEEGTITNSRRNEDKSNDSAEN